MITIKSKSEIELMKIAGRVTGETLKRVEEAVKPGVTTRELDKIAEDSSEELIVWILSDSHAHTLT